MNNFEKIQSVLIELLKEEYILRDSSKNWYRLKEYRDEVYKYFRDYFGYELIVSNNIAKIQKFSLVGEKTKGIETFSSNEEYAILALCLDFLEDKYEGETILISELLEYIVSNYPIEQDWKERSINLSLVKVLRYCVEKDLLKKLDGSETDFINETEEEILYENTGFSKYFMNNLPYNISELDTLEKIESYNIKDLNQDQIVRRSLMENFIVNSDFPYYPYLLENKDRFSLDFEHLLDMRLICFKEFSYLIKQEESSNVSKSFPGNNNLEKILVLFLSILKKKDYEKQEILEEFEKFKFEYNSVFTKGNLGKESKVFLDEILLHSKRLNLIKLEDNKIIIRDFVNHFEIDLVKGDENE